MNLSIFVLLTSALAGSADERAKEAINLAGGSCVCRTDMDLWKQFHDSYWNCFNRPSACNDFREQLYESVLGNYTRVFECNVGVVAGYALIGSRALEAGSVDLAYRSYQMAMVFVYTLRRKQRIPVQQEILWRVSTDKILGTIQSLKQYLGTLEIPSIVGQVHPARPNKIALVSICAYASDHPLVLKDITPKNRREYASTHGYDAVVLASHPLGEGSNVCIQHSKLALMTSLLESGRYDWIMWLDCDSIIVNQKRRIEDIISEFATPSTEVIITEELLGLSSANWIIKNSEWAINFLKTAFEIAHTQLPYFGDQDAIISMAMAKGVLDEHVTIIPQTVINTYDALNAFYMQSRAYDFEKDLLVTFPQCKDVACNDLFLTAYEASKDSARTLMQTPVNERSWAQLRVFGPADTVARIYEEHRRR